jgi:hypothetical protein
VVDIKSVTLKPIAREDLINVGRFLHEHLNRRISPETWATCATPPWQVDSPNFGFSLVANGTIVGVHLAFYSERTIDGERTSFCNLAAFCVSREYRSYSVPLLRALLAQERYHFTDLSPSGNVVPLNALLKLRHLDTATALVPNLPWPLWSSSIRVISDPTSIQNHLSEQDLSLYRDHARAAAARHAVIVAGSQSCYVIYRKDRRKNLPLFASILYIGNPELFKTAAPHFFRHLLLHHGIPVTLAEMRVVQHRPRISLLLRSGRPKMYRSARLRADQIDYLYSELTCVPW